jgi:crossover junction endodeoxyribonuclease RuvC
MSRKSTRTSTFPTRCSSTRSRPVILGIDPGTTGMGYAFLVAGGERATLVECGLVDVRASSSAAERLLAISEALDALIRRHHPSALAVERLFFNKNARTAMRVSEARGVALLCGARAGLEIAEYTPQDVKMSVTGDGRGDKKSVQRMLPHLVALDAPITQDNVADAVAIALTHLQRARFAAVVAAAQ